MSCHSLQGPAPVGGAWFPGAPPTASRTSGRSAHSGALPAGGLSLGLPREPLPHPRVRPGQGRGLRAAAERLLPAAGRPHLPLGPPAALPDLGLLPRLSLR